MLRSFLCASGPDAMLTDVSLAIEAEPEWSPWWDTALCLLGEAKLLRGDLAGARQAFTASCSSGTALGNAGTAVHCESELALLAMDGGEWDDAAAHLDRALALIDEHGLHDYVISAIAVVGAARLALHRGDLETMNQELGKAMRARPTATYVVPYIAVRLRLQLARLYLALAHPTTAKHLQREIDDILHHRPDLGRLGDEAAALRAQLAASGADDRAGRTPLSPAELRLLPYLQTHLTFADIGGRLYVSRNTVSTQAKSIYRKLGANSRSEAVALATAAGLLGG
jgi:LuxR family maltose regulon positive regulatory protein